jgi:hypothetical protein
MLGIGSGRSVPTMGIIRFLILAEGLWDRHLIWQQAYAIGF